MAEPNLLQRIVSNILATIRLAGGTKVSVVEPGKAADGINRRLIGSGGDIDRPYTERYTEIQDTLEAWRKNPLARRIVGLVTAYVVGDGIIVTSKYKQLQDFIDEFWNIDQNHVLLNQADWCDELTRSGELFLVLFTNPTDGMSHVRAIPASTIDDINWRDGDYKRELQYHQVTEDPEGKWWKSFDHPDAADPTVPIMLHFAINRPVGAMRGEGDLNPILPWLRRYSAWLEDRVRLNAGIRSFLWIVYAPKRAFEELNRRYAKPPEPGSIIIAEEGAEKWEPVTPSLQAADAEPDGRALRWYIAAGAPGLALTDFGEAEDANQATATVMKDIRGRFLKRRQAYFVWMLGELTLKAYARSRALRNANRRACTHNDLITDPPEISGEDSLTLAGAANDLANAMTTMQKLLGDSTEYRELALRLFGTFAEQQIPRPIAERIIAKGEEDLKRRNSLEEEKTRAEIKRATTPRPTPRKTTPRKPKGQHDDDGQDNRNDAGQPGPGSGPPVDEREATE